MSRSITDLSPIEAVELESQIKSRSNADTLNALHTAIAQRDELLTVLTDLDNYLRRTKWMQVASDNETRTRRAELLLNARAAIAIAKIDTNQA